MHFLDHIRHIIWDWNGTLVDDVDYCVSLINGILESRSLPGITVTTYKDTFDFPVIEYYKRVGFDLKKDSFETLSNEFISGYSRDRQQLKLHQGALDALNFFKQRNLPQCMLSASQSGALHQALKEQNINTYFKTILGLDHHYADGKVHLGKRWLDIHQIDRTQVLFIGDTLHDLEVAKEMGVHCLLTATGHHSKARLQACHSHVIKDLPELISLFKEAKA